MNELASGRNTFQEGNANSIKLQWEEMWNVIGKQMTHLRSLRLRLESLGPWPEYKHVDAIISAPKAFVRGVQDFELELIVTAGKQEMVYDGILIEREIREEVCRPSTTVEG